MPNLFSFLRAEPNFTPFFSDVSHQEVPPQSDALHPVANGKQC